MDNIKVLGIDLAKDIFQICGADERGKTLLRKRLTRSKFIEFMANHESCLVGIEACGTSHYWSRHFSRSGHDVKIIAPQFVKPYVKSNKNDPNDAEGIKEAVMRPSMRFVPVKTIEQQDLQSLHRIRSARIKERTATANQLRSLLAEYGIVLARGIKVLKKQLTRVLEDAGNELSPLMREELSRLGEHFSYLDEQAAYYDKKLTLLAREDDRCKRLLKIPGFGVMTATALVAAVGNGAAFKSGREMAAFLGLVPRQSSSGKRIKLLGISKGGDKHLRTLLIHGARALMRWVANKSDPFSCWIKEKVARSNANKTAVAVACKNARIAWVILTKNEEYAPRYPH